MSERYELAKLVVGDLVLSWDVYDHETKKLSPPMSEDCALRALRMLRLGWTLGCWG